MLPKSVLLRVAPIIFNLLLIFWTIIVSPHSTYGDNWAIYPVLIIFLLIIIWHISLVVIETSKLIFMAYGLIHLFLSFFLWIYCLMKISKDVL